MNVNDIKQSRFLTRHDVGKGFLATIKGVHQENVAKEGAPEDLKWAMEFDELEKPLILNNTNGNIIASITGSQESDDWIGHKIVMFDDPNVSFGGKLVGGIRVRAPRNQPAAPKRQAPARASAPAANPAEATAGESHPESSEDDNMPF